MGTYSPIQTAEIPVIDGRGNEWQEAVSHLLTLGKNFVVILCDEASNKKRLRELLEYEPSTLQKVDTYVFKEVLTAEDNSRIDDATGKGDCIFFVEIIKRPKTRPPNTKPYLVYCGLRGMIAEADSLNEAKEACAHRSTDLARCKGYQDIKVYEWRANEWQPLRISCI